MVMIINSYKIFYFTYLSFRFWWKVGARYQRNLSSTYVLDGKETGQWDFINNGVYGYDTVTIGNLKLKKQYFVEATSGANSNVKK